MAFHNLKACPFCGGRPYIESRHRAFVNGETTRVAFVRCSDCNARTQRIPISIGNGEAVRRACNSWNARYDDLSFISVGDHLS